MRRRQTVSGRYYYRIIVVELGRCSGYRGGEGRCQQPYLVASLLREPDASRPQEPDALLPREPDTLLPREPDTLLPREPGGRAARFPARTAGLPPTSATS